MSRIRLFVIFLFLLSTACGRGEETAVSPSRTAQPTYTAPAPSATPKPSPTAAPPTVTPPATSTPRPQDTAPPPPTATPVPSATPTAGPHAPDVTQPDYTASACSDRFPCSNDVAAWEARIQVPDGFTVRYLTYFPATDPEADWPSLHPTSITFGPDGRLYVAMREGMIYAVSPEEGSFELFADGFTVPTGIAFQPGTERLYVSNRVLDRNVGGEGQISVVEDGETRSLFAGLPCCYIGMHGPNGIAFGPDGYGYVGVGGRADHGEILDGTNTQDELHPWEASILRFSPDGETVEVYASGLRNPYDITWTAGGELYATDNGRDELSGETVPDELHRVMPGGEHGYPYYECPTCFGIPEDIEIVPPVHEFPPHSVPTGVAAYLAEEFPGYYNSLFLTLWTALPFAERVIRYTPDDGQASTFAAGFAAPMDVAVGPTGDLYVADYATGIMFQISYEGR